MLSGLTSFLPESTLTLYDNLEFLFRILLATVLGAAIGLERTKRQKEKVSPGRMSRWSRVAAASFRLNTLFSWYTMSKPVSRLYMGQLVSKRGYGSSCLSRQVA